MLDDHDHEAGALPAVRAYDRQQIEQYLALLEHEATHLRERLDAARARRARADAILEQGAASSSGLSSAVHLALDELGHEEATGAAAIDELRARSVREARRILAEAEREALLLRAAIEAAFRELAEEPDDEDPTARPTLAAWPTAPLREPALDLQAVRDRLLAHPSAGRRPVPHLRSVRTGPTLVR